MTAVLAAPAPAYRTEVLGAGSAAWHACETDLATLGVRLPLPHRATWTSACPHLRSRCVALRSRDGSCAAAFGVQEAASRALLGFRLLRVERLGEALPRPLWAAAVAALAELARRESRVLRLSVEVFSRDDDVRAGLGELLAQAGFARAATTRNWDTTLMLDLRPGEDELLESFSALARRAIRSIAKLPVEVRPVDDPALGDRLEILSRETRARTGGRYEALWNWAGVIEVSRRVPDASRLIGLFRTDRAGPGALLGFAWGWWNGQSVSYFAGASTRPKDLHGVSIGHPLMWDLIRWAKRDGATWFDLGGVTSGTTGSGDPLGGISDFKRLFSKRVAAVAEDWVLQPHAVPARLAAVLSTSAAWLARTRIPRRPVRERGAVYAGPAGPPPGPPASVVGRVRRAVLRVAAADVLAPALRSLGRGLVSIYTLHRFSDPENGIVGHDPAALRDHLAYLRRHHYRLLSLSEVLTLVEEGRPGGNVPAVAYTVDDGYDDFARVAAPIFAEYDCPVTLFVPTGFVDGKLWLWWDRVTYLFTETTRGSIRIDFGAERHTYRWSTPGERARVLEEVLDSLQMLPAPSRETAIASLVQQLDVELPGTPPKAFAPISWDEVRRAGRRGVTFGPHTVTHQILPLASDADCHWEIEESYRRLRQETDAVVPVLCYPAGKAKLRELEAAHRAGLRAAVTTLPGYAVPLRVGGCGALARFALPRFPYPDDQPHLVNMVTGLARWRGRIRHPQL